MGRPGRAPAAASRTKETIPAIGEVLPGFDVVSWQAIFAPAGVPRPVVDKLAGEMLKAVQDPEIKAKLVAARAPGLDRTKIQTEIASLLAELKSTSESAVFSGENWLQGDSTGPTTKSIVASFSRDSSGAVSIGTIELDVGPTGTMMYDTSGSAAGIMDQVRTPPSGGAGMPDFPVTTTMSEPSPSTHDSDSNEPAPAGENGQQDVSQHNSFRIPRYDRLQDMAAFAPEPPSDTPYAGISDIRADLDPANYLKWIERWLGDGASVVGGCCGIGPEHIEAIRIYREAREAA